MFIRRRRKVVRCGYLLLTRIMRKDMRLLLLSMICGCAGIMIMRILLFYTGRMHSHVFWRKPCVKGEFLTRYTGGLSFYQRKEIKDIISYFRLIVNPHDEEAFKRVINYPSRGIGDTTVGKLISAATEIM